MDEYDSKKVFVKGTNEEEQNVQISLDPIEKLIVADKIELDPIFFEFDKYNITSEAAFELDKVVQIMTKYPDMVLKIVAHTDIRGSENYNAQLSEKRAKSTEQYIISKGIDESRVSSEGKGESEPKVDCSGGCTKEQHQENRRSEFIIVSGGPRA
jgi:outer membrane protein OmpA-like peptidoglycan-associated protein